MRAKHAITTAIATAMAHSAAAEFNTSCAWWILGGQGTLAGYCAGGDPASSINRHWAASTLDLDRCIGVDPTANAMVWQAGGGAFRTLCSGCGMQSSQVVMQCGCVNVATGGETSSSVNLNDRIFVSEDGQLTC